MTPMQDLIGRGYEIRNLSTLTRNNVKRVISGSLLSVSQLITEPERMFEEKGVGKKSTAEIVAWIAAGPTNPRIKALIKSHQALLKIAHDYRSLIESDYEGRNGIVGAMANSHSEAVAAIEEAEKL